MVRTTVAPGHLRVAVAVALGVALVGVSFSSPRAGRAQSSTSIEPSQIVAAPDGNLWFTETAANKIGRMAPDGRLTEYALPTAKSSPFGITAGPDGNLWVTQSDADKVARVSPEGTITEYPVPTVDGGPFDITAGPDGNLWLTEANVGKVAKVTPAGAVTEYPVPTANGGPFGITSGPDGNLWVTGFSDSRTGKVSKLLKVTPNGVVTEYPTPTVDSRPWAITVGPDHNLWFTEAFVGKVGRATPSGAITEFALPDRNCYAYGITSGSDGNLWVTEADANKVARVTPGGAITEFSVPTPNSSPEGITAGPDGNLWFTERERNTIASVTPAGIITEYSIVAARPQPAPAQPPALPTPRPAPVVEAPPGMTVEISRLQRPNQILLDEWRNEIPQQPYNVSPNDPAYDVSLDRDYHLQILAIWEQADAQGNRNDAIDEDELRAFLDKPAPAGVDPREYNVLAYNAIGNFQLVRSNVGLNNVQLAEYIDRMLGNSDGNLSISEIDAYIANEQDRLETEGDPGNRYQARIIWAGQLKFYVAHA